MAEVVLDLEKIKHPYSGLGQFCIHLSQAIIKHSDKGFIAAYLPKGNYDLFPSIEKKEWKPYHKLTGVSVKASIWHSFHQEAVYFPKDSSIKRVLTIHDLNFLDKYNGSKKEKMLKRLQLLVNQSSAITYISNYTKEIAESNLILPKKILTKVIYNGVAVSKNSMSLKPTWIKGVDPFLFTIGIVGEKKNFHVLVEIMNHLPELKLYICGKKDSNYAKEIQTLIIKYKLSSRVFLTGEISEGEKIWMYKNCSAFVFPSKNEGFGLPVVEAMSFGKPLILSSFTSLPEIGGDLASYFKGFLPLEMAKLIRDSINNHSKEKAIKIIERSRLFDWNNASIDYLNLYADLLKEN
jgi:glycosyltransferase involved in cell wall biosynthesis